MKRDDDGIPILPSYDDQLCVIIIGEAGVGKSHVLRCLMWFAYTHGWANSTVVTSYQGRPVSNSRNLVARGMTSCMLHQINARANNSGRINAISKTN
jgi:ABC-type phosphate/phosphonate transport system ATPase subunit